MLVISEATVKTHITRIFDKLGLRDRGAAIGSPSTRIWFSQCAVSLSLSGLRMGRTRLCR